MLRCHLDQINTADVNFGGPITVNTAPRYGRPWLVGERTATCSKALDERLSFRKTAGEVCECHLELGRSDDSRSASNLPIPAARLGQDHDPWQAVIGARRPLRRTGKEQLRRREAQGSLRRGRATH